MWLFTASAIAASPGGYRVGPALPVRSVELRQAVVLGPTTVSQTTLAARTHLGGRFSAIVQAPFVVSSGDPPLAGFGLLRLGAEVHLGYRADRVFSVGVELASQWVPNTAVAQSWATVERDTAPASEAVTYAAVSLFPSTPLTLRIGAGFRQARYDRYGGFPRPRFLAEGSIAQVLPIYQRSSIVLEAEWMVDSIPISARTLFRIEPPKITVDAGAQLSMAENGANRIGLLIAVRRFF